MTFTAPSIWYLARLELQLGGVIGATVPGIHQSGQAGVQNWVGASQQHMSMIKTLLLSN